MNTHPSHASRRETLVVTVGALVVLGVLLIGVRRPPNVFDEGYALVGADRILRGEVPYRDFWLVYAPGQVYVLAALLKLSGSSMLVARLYDVLVRLAIVVLMHRIARKLSGPVAATVAAAVGTVWLAQLGFYLYAVYPALALSLVGVWLTLRYLDQPRRLTGFLCGVSVGVMTLFRHDFGLYGALAIATVLVASCWTRHAPEQAAASSRLREVWTTLWPLVAGALLPVVPAVLALLASVPARDLWFDLVAFPAAVLNKYRALPLPHLPWLGMSRDARSTSVLFYFPMAVLAATVVLLVYRRRLFGVWLIALLGLFYLRQAVNRADGIHLLPTTVMVAMLAPVLVSQAWRARRSRLVWILAAAAGLVAVDAYVITPFDQLTMVRRQMAVGADYALPRARGLRMNPDVQDVVRYLQAHTAAGEAIFVGNSRHDLLPLNQILLYFLADRPCAVRYHDLTPGVATTAAVQEEIIADLRRHDVRTIVIDHQWDRWPAEPNLSGQSSGVTLLDQYLRSHFRPVSRLGSFEIALRDPQPIGGR